MKKKPWRILGAVLAVGILTVLATRIFADLVNQVYSASSASNIGSWTDELWQAESLYTANGCSGGPGYCYNYTDYAHLGAGPYTDIFVTEWKMTGHVHFQTGP